MVFFDTNILLYAGSNDPGDKKKKAIATDLIESLDFLISSQVIQESILTQRGRPPQRLGAPTPAQERGQS